VAKQIFESNASKEFELLRGEILRMQEISGKIVKKLYRR
jgi:hypothetical protein